MKSLKKVVKASKVENTKISPEEVKDEFEQDVLDIEMSELEEYFTPDVWIFVQFRCMYLLIPVRNELICHHVYVSI